VVNVIAREKGHWLVYRERQVLVRRTARNRMSEREPLSFVFYCSIHTIAERFVEVNRTGTGPEEAEGSISYLEEQVQVLDRGIVQAVRCPNTGLSWPAKDLA